MDTKHFKSSIWIRIATRIRVKKITRVRIATRILDTRIRVATRIRGYMDTKNVKYTICIRIATRIRGYTDTHLVF